MNTPSSHSRLPYRPDIDGLRAVAVLAVLFCHAGLGLPGGYVGVDVFFVLSGYLITSLILKDLAQGKFSLADFWERRVRRIFPALAAVTLTTLIAGWFLLLPDAYGDLAKSVLALIFLVANVYFWRSTDYFSTLAEEKPLLHTWSLAVEEQFYLLVPIVLILLAKANQLRRALPLLGFVLVISFGVSVVGAHLSPDATFYLLPTRTWELLAGTLLAFAVEQQVNSPLRSAKLISVVGIGLILAPCVLYRETTPFPGLAAVPPVLGTVLLIWSGTQAGRLPLLNQLLAARPVVFIGLISYSLYLWHWPLFALVKSQSLQPLSVELRWALVAASGLLAIASWRFIETPFRRRQVLAPRASLFRAASLSFVGFLCAAVALSFLKGLESRLPPAARRFAAQTRLDPQYRYQPKVSDIPDKLPVFGDRHASPSLIIWGDSHAMALFPVVSALCKEKGVTASGAAYQLTPPVLNYTPLLSGSLKGEAATFNRTVFEYIRSRRLKAAILAARWDQYSRDPRFPEAFKETVAALRDNNVRVYIVCDVAEFPYVVPKALALYSWRGWDFSQLGLASHVGATQRESHTRFFAGLAREGVTVLDPIPVLQEGTASVKILPYGSQGSFYRDGHHLTTYGALMLKPLFEPIFNDIVKDNEIHKTSRLAQDLSPQKETLVSIKNRR